MFGIDRIVQRFKKKEPQNPNNYLVTFNDPKKGLGKQSTTWMTEDRVKEKINDKTAVYILYPDGRVEQVKYELDSTQ